MGTTMSSSPSSSSSNGSSLGNGSQGLGRSTRGKGLFNGFHIGGKRPVDELRDYGSPLSDASSPIDSGVWSAGRECGNRSHHHFLTARDTASKRGRCSTRSGNSYASTKTTPSMSSARSSALGGRKKQSLLNGWSVTKRTAFSLLPNALFSSSRNRSSTYSFSSSSKQPSIEDYSSLATNNNNNNNSSICECQNVRHEPNRANVMSLGSSNLCFGNNNFDLQSPPTTTVALSSRNKAISKVREIFEAAAKNRRREERENIHRNNNYDGSRFQNSFKEMKSGRSRGNPTGIRECNDYCYNYTYKNEAYESVQSPPSATRQPSKEMESTSSSTRGASKIDIGAVTSRLRHGLKLSSQDFKNNNSIETSYEGMNKKAKTPLSPTHTSHPLRVFAQEYVRDGRETGNMAQSHREPKRSSLYTEIVPKSSRSGTDSRDQVVPTQRPLSWATYTRSDPSPYVVKASATGGSILRDGANNSSNRRSARRTVQASTSELLRALSNFISIKSFALLLNLRMAGEEETAGSPDPTQVTLWLRQVDRALILQGWQDIAFINPANLVFVYMLVRDRFAHCLRRGELLENQEELHALVLTCLYISYSYMGNEISYPLKPFVKDTTDRTVWWSRCIEMINTHSADMLRLNASSGYFFEVFSELKEYADC